MGLIITSPIHTNQGDTSELYLNIEMVTIKKDSINNVMINTYFNKENRDTNIRNKCKTFKISNIYNLSLTIEELASNNLYPLIYTKLKLIIEGLGLIVVDDNII
jgi:hypothetical protein